MRQGTQGGNHTGVRGLVWQANNQEPSEDCGRIGGLVHFGGGGAGFVEFAWIIGWDYCGANNDYQEKPYYITVWRTTLGNYNCEGQGDFAEGVFSEITVSDTNTDTLWAAKKGDTVYKTMDVDFSRGTGYSFTERFTNYDLAWGHFKSLDWYLAGGDNWLNWNDLDPGGDDDPDYACDFMSQTEHKINMNPPSCSD